MCPIEALPPGEFLFNLGISQGPLLFNLFVLELPNFVQSFLTQFVNDIHLYSLSTQKKTSALTKMTSIILLTGAIQTKWLSTLKKFRL